MTAPTLSERAHKDVAEWGDPRLMCAGDAHIHALVLEMAAEIERLTSQLEAAGLAKPAPEKHGCHCDIENMPDGYQPDDCVMDYGDHDSCVYARQLQREGKDKTACQYWRPIKMPEGFGNNR